MKTDSIGLDTCNAFKVTNRGKTNIYLIKCDSDIYKTASRQDVKPRGDVLSAPTAPAINQGHLSDAIRVKLKAILLKVLKSLNRGHPTLRRKLSFGDSNGEKVRDAYNVCVAEEESFFFSFSCRLLFCHM